MKYTTRLEIEIEPDEIDKPVKEFDYTYSIAKDIEHFADEIEKRYGKFTKVKVSKIKKLDKINLESLGYDFVFFT